MSSSVSGGGGELTIYLKHYESVSDYCLYVHRDCATNLQTLIVLLLLFVYYAEAEIDLVGFFKIGLHLHDLGECFLGMV